MRFSDVSVFGGRRWALPAGRCLVVLASILTVMALLVGCDPKKNGARAGIRAYEANQLVPFPMGASVNVIGAARVLIDTRLTFAVGTCRPPLVPRGQEGWGTKISRFFFLFRVWYSFIKEIVTFRQKNFHQKTRERERETGH